ncbi:hypothetical protein ADEAN_000369400 [Angomonas deanei]|uniref:Uncharacterized protein n=1 Tax=Angomonas deanei TaxID=59799 RepID=A0A7G2CBY3_9TRYP|nr:hypothetical protein ADEAN_000369400 [Angomonas deanei]
MLQKERKDLLAQKKQLEGQVAKYRKASKYRHHVEVAKKDIADLTDENRDLQLEVRCNEKLLVMNANVIESGEGHQRLAEELRAQNALTQRSLEHAVRDCTDAERQRDGVKQRVEALREKQADLKRSENGENDYNTLQRLREENRQKKNTISQLKQQLNVSQKQSYLGGQSAPSDAERSYLEERIAHMRLELERAKQQVRKASTPMANSAHAIEPPSEVAPASPPKQEAGWLNNSAANSPVHPAKDSSAQNEFRELEEPVEAPKQEDNYVQNTNTGFDFLTEDAPPPKPVKDIFADDDIFGTNDPAPTLAPAEPAKNDVPDWLAGDEDDAAEEGMEEEPLEDEVEDYVEEEEAAEEAKEEEKPAWLEF